MRTVSVGNAMMPFRQFSKTIPWAAAAGDGGKAARRKKERWPMDGADIFS